MLKEDFGGILSLMAIFGISSFFIGLIILTIREAQRIGVPFEGMLAFVGLWIVIWAMALSKIFSED